VNCRINVVSLGCCMFCAIFYDDFGQVLNLTVLIE
jgi:hypothetical protein